MKTLEEWSGLLRQELQGQIQQTSGDESATTKKTASKTNYGEVK